MMGKQDQPVLSIFLGTRMNAERAFVERAQKKGLGKPQSP